MPSTHGPDTERRCTEKMAWSRYSSCRSLKAVEVESHLQKASNVPAWGTVLTDNSLPSKMMVSSRKSCSQTPLKPNGKPEMMMVVIGTVGGAYGMMKNGKVILRNV